jgi:hypothetical protein
MVQALKKKTSRITLRISPLPKTGQFHSPQKVPGTQGHAE